MYGPQRSPLTKNRRRRVNGAEGRPDVGCKSNTSNGPESTPAHPPSKAFRGLRGTLPVRPFQPGGNAGPIEGQARVNTAQPAPVGGLWLGPHHLEAAAAFGRARELGLSLARAHVVGNVASFRDCWAFRSRLARAVRVSVRTVQRALTQAADVGLIGRARAKPSDVPPGLTAPVPCGWSHRWTVGWGAAGELARQAVARARAVRLLRRSVGGASTLAGRILQDRPRRPQRAEYQGRHWTAQELDDELARLARERPEPEPGDTS